MAAPQEPPQDSVLFINSALSNMRLTPQFSSGMHYNQAILASFSNKYISGLILYDLPVCTVGMAASMTEESEPNHCLPLVLFLNSYEVLCQLIDENNGITSFYLFLGFVEHRFQGESLLEVTACMYT